MNSNEEKVVGEVSPTINTDIQNFFQIMEKVSEAFGSNELLTKNKLIRKLGLPLDQNSADFLFTLQGLGIIERTITPEQVLKYKLIDSPQKQIDLLSGRIKQLDNTIREAVKEAQITQNIIDSLTNIKANGSERSS